MQQRTEPSPYDVQYPTHYHDTPYTKMLIDKAEL